MTCQLHLESHNPTTAMIGPPPFLYLCLFPSSSVVPPPNLISSSPLCCYFAAVVFVHHLCRACAFTVVFSFASMNLVCESLRMNDIDIYNMVTVIFDLAPSEGIPNHSFPQGSSSPSSTSSTPSTVISRLAKVPLKRINPNSDPINDVGNLLSNSLVQVMASPEVHPLSSQPSLLFFFASFCCSENLFFFPFAFWVSFP